METKTYTIEIAAPVRVVWRRMLDDVPYRAWTSEFQPGSHYVGSWELGSDIRFLGPDEDGDEGGLVARVVESLPYERVSIEYLGFVADGQDDTTSDLAREFAGARETYAFTETDGTTTLTVRADMLDDWAADMDAAWLKALAALKALAEREA
jgi:Activator of Hsp90 ATPase homolog 1-like protein